MEWFEENFKFEARNPKFETNFNDRNAKFKITSFWKFEFCDYFGFRYSDFEFVPVT